MSIVINEMEVTDLNLFINTLPRLRRQRIGTPCYIVLSSIDHCDVMMLLFIRIYVHIPV